MKNEEAAIFSQRGGSKRFEDWSGLKNFRTEGGEGTFAEGGQYLITCHDKRRVIFCVDRVGLFAVFQAGRFSSRKLKAYRQN